MRKGDRLNDEAGLLGLDHPLVTVPDRVRALQAFTRLGFVPTPVTLHPWGTWTSIIVMQRDLIELIGIHDHAAVDAERRGEGFAFGAYIRDFLADEDGISLLALHSADIGEDTRRLNQAGIPITRRIDFRRAVTLPDGTADEAQVSLLILYDEDCRPHRNSSVSSIGDAASGTQDGRRTPMAPWA